MVLSLALNNVYAQQIHKCATDEITEQLIASDPGYAEKYAKTQALYKVLEKAEVKQKTSGVVYIIPVVFHVIYNDYRDNISRLQIEDGIRVLNEDFRRLNSDASNLRSIFNSVAADVEIEFRLAKKDANGNCTDGITRTQSALSINARHNVKPLINWDNTKYLNIWVVNSIASGTGSPPGTILGFASFPVFGGQNFLQDGMVIRHDQVGTIGTAIDALAAPASSAKGRTITHEAGHYLGLPHTFQGGCTGTGDGFADTPPVALSNDGCDPLTNTCSNDNPNLPDMIENYMDYSDGSCQNTFTALQTARMRAVLESTNFRQNLRSATNLINTGITNPPACANPIAIAEVDEKLICLGETINFFDASEDADPDTWSWTFNGGTPATSSVKNPSVTYNTAGNFDVTLVVSTANGSDTTVYTNLVSVKNPGSTAFYPNWADHFEDPSVSPEVTLLSEGDDEPFRLFTSSGSGTSSQSLKLDNFNVSIEGEIDNIISPAIATNFTQNLSLSFDYSFAAIDNTNDDELNVYASTDCGQTWILRRFYRGNQLTTATNTAQAFTPSSAADWSTKTISFSAFSGTDPLLVKIEFVAGGGNNIFIDNINFSGTIGLDEYESNLIEIYPNPAQSMVAISGADGFNLLNAELTFSDITGKQIFKHSILENSKEYRLNLQEYNLTPGVYLISITNQENQKAFKKVIIE